MSRCRSEEPVRLVVSDVDGTLVDKDKKLTPASSPQSSGSAAGVGFTIISARPRSGMMPIADTLAIDDPMVRSTAAPSSAATAV